jgi:hypothetical protein
MKKILNWVLAATLISGFTVSVTSCQDNEDNPAPAKKMYTLFDRDYTYTIADGHIVEMVEVATTEIKTAVYSRSETKTTTTTFTYEEM